MYKCRNGGDGNVENKDVSYWINCGTEYILSGKFKEAENCLHEVIRLTPNIPEAHYILEKLLSEITTINRKEPLYRDAFNELDKATRLEPDNGEIFHCWGTLLSELACAKQDESLFKESFEKYYKATQLMPDYAIAFNSWGHSLYKFAVIKQDVSLLEEACEKYEKAIQLKPDFAIAFINLGHALSDLAVIKHEEFLFKKTIEIYYNVTLLEPQNAHVFYGWGCTLLNFAEIKREESLFVEACEKYSKAIQLKPDFFNAFVKWGNALSDLAYIKCDESLSKESFDKYYKATQLKPDDVLPFNNWGIGLYYLSEMKLDYSLFSKEFERFEKTSQQVNDTMNFFIKGALYFILNDENKAEEYFRKSETNLLGIFAFLSKENIKKIMQTPIPYQLLDSDADDGHFFKETTKGLSNKNVLDKYKKIYILSIYIISQLHVRNEKYVAHYQKKTVSQKILFDDKESKFRLNAINYSNDPTEGKTLLDYLLGEEKYNVKDTSNKEYEVFAGCFTLNQDNLHQFRLYGKENREEGVGLSLVFRDSFFSEEAKMAMKQEDNIFKKKEKYALFRCMYIDPIVRRVVTVGRKEEYLFYREENINKNVIDDYNNYISEVLENIRDKMEELKELVKGLDSVVIGRLLLNLRYLTKHIAFKEEQECRIVKICRLTDKKINISSDEDYKQMYIDYDPKVSDHIEKIYFGPKATGMELFQDILTNKRLNIPCKRSENPLA